MHSSFTRRRFQRLSNTLQHKYCALAARACYLSSLDKAEQEYSLFIHWLGISLPLPTNKKEWADRYHWHKEQFDNPYQPLPDLPSIRKGDRPYAEPSWPVSVYLDNLRSAHNVGSIIRTVEAFGLGTLYLSSSTPAIDHPQIQKTAMGTEKGVSIAPLSSLDDLPRPLIALETSNEAPSVYEFPFPEQCTIALGNEEYGCSDAILSTADALVTIPLRGRKNSLNVANAFAIVAAEITRQRIYDRETIL